MTDPDQTSMPFGCRFWPALFAPVHLLISLADTFPNPDPDDSTSSTHQPSGPPLLDNNESNLLGKFFENPNNIDPSFVADSSEEMSKHRESYPNHTTDWMYPSQPTYPNGNSQASGPSPYTMSVAPQQSQSYATLPNAEGQHFSDSRGQHGDVEEAAGILNTYFHAHRSNQSSLGAFNGGGQAPFPTSQGADGYGNYNLAPSPYGAASYRFPESRELGSSPNDGAAFGDDRRATDPTDMGDSQGRMPLNFGSDEKFQPNKYIAPRQEPPDAFMTNAVVAYLKQNESLKERSDGDIDQPRLNAQQTKRRKRGRPMLMTNEEGSSGSIESDNSDHGPSAHKRRKSKAGDLGLDTSSPKMRGAKRALKAKEGQSPDRTPRTPSSNSKQPRENLSEEQKRSNHIQSEQKRRNLIRQGFEDINRMVPELRSGGFSKSNMLTEAAKFARMLKEGNDHLRSVLESLENG